jgi:hypothetical protein
MCKIEKLRDLERWRKIEKKRNERDREGGRRRRKKW